MCGAVVSEKSRVLKLQVALDFRSACPAVVNRSQLALSPPLVKWMLANKATRLFSAIRDCLHRKCAMGSDQRL